MHPTSSSFLAELTMRADPSTLPDLTRRPIRLCLRSAHTLYRTAELYHQAGDCPNAYVLLLKYCNLLVYGLQRHPEWRGVREGREAEGLKRDAVKAMDRMEELRPLLQTWWEEHVRPALSLPSSDDSLESIHDVAKEPHATLPEIAELRARKRREEIERFHSQKTLDNCLHVLPLPLPDGGPIVNEKDHAEYDHKAAISKEEFMEKQSIVAPKKTLHFTESGMPLRPVLLPVSLIDVFTRIASINTDRNIETCGVLGGRLEDDIFIASHLMVPRQKGTSDTVVMEGEEDVAEAAISHGLITLGWIHTHPTQSCFLSSVDQHTQFPFQALMAEAVAVVVSPRRQPNYGVFRLTDPPGVQLVGRCRQDGFHPHPTPDERPVYVEVSNRGHISLRSDLPITVIDLRLH